MEPGLWKYLISLCEQQSQILKIEILQLDFKIGAIEAFPESFLRSFPRYSN